MREERRGEECVMKEERRREERRREERRGVCDERGEERSV